MKQPDLSRRNFMRAALAFSFMGSSVLSASARKGKKAKEEVVAAERLLARIDWPPALVPSYVGLCERDYVFVADDQGRLAIVDPRHADTAHVLGELAGLGKKVACLASTQHRAFAIVQNDDFAEPPYSLVTLSLTPASEPSIMSKYALGEFSEPLYVACNNEVVVVAGYGRNRENLLLFFSAGRRKAGEPVQYASATTDQAVVSMIMDERHLFVLTGPDGSDLLQFTVQNQKPSELVASLNLDGSYQLLAKNREAVVVGGITAERKVIVKLLTVRPKISFTKQIILPALTELLDLVALKGQLLFLGLAGETQTFLPATYDKKWQIVFGNQVTLPGSKRALVPKSRMSAREKDVYVVSDSGIQVLARQKAGWALLYDHAVPRLPASNVVLSSGLAVLAGVDLKTYDLSNPHRPTLSASVDLPVAVRSLAAVGRSILVLTRDDLSLRPAENPSSIYASLRCGGLCLAFDEAQSRACVVSSVDKDSILSFVQANEDNMTLEKQEKIPGRYYMVASAQGLVALASINDLVLFSLEQGVLYSRNFSNLAIRDLKFLSGRLLLTCIDKSLQGSLLVLNPGKEGLPTEAALDLKQDALSLAVSGKNCLVIGKNKEKRDQITIIDVSDLVRPRILDTEVALEAASAVTIKDGLAVVAGRGLEVLRI